MLSMLSMLSSALIYSTPPFSCQPFRSMDMDPQRTPARRIAQPVQHPTVERVDTTRLDPPQKQKRRMHTTSLSIIIIIIIMVNIDAASSSCMYATP